MNSNLLLASRDNIAHALRCRATRWDADWALILDSGWEIRAVRGRLVRPRQPAAHGDSRMYAQKADGLGSVNRLTDSSGNTVYTYTYDAWGSPTQTGTLSNPFEFTAREWDSTNALYYDRARFYDPSANGAHRFLSADPLGGGYAYVGDSPMNFVDPTGPMYSRPCGGRGTKRLSPSRRFPR